MKRLLILCCALFLTLFSGASCPTPPKGFTPGVVDNGFCVGEEKFGAHLVRHEFDIGASASSMASLYSTCAAKGISVLPLAGFSGRLPTTAESQNLGNWSKAYGPNGTFWTGRSDGYLASQFIEFGNETSYGYQYGNDGPGSASYTARARNYALAFKTAKQSIANGVGLLAQAEDGGSGSSAWVDNMYAAVPELSSLVNGWTVHPYGPRSRWEPKIDRLIQFTAAHGAPSFIPIDITEYGIATDNGRTLTGNSDGWPTNLTYSQAATDLQSAVDGIRNKYGSRIRYFFIYGNKDGRDPGTSTNRESYFGVIQNNLSDKGAYTAYTRNLYSQATQKAINATIK